MRIMKVIMIVVASIEPPSMQCAELHEHDSAIFVHN